MLFLTCILGFPLGLAFTLALGDTSLFSHILYHYICRGGLVQSRISLIFNHCDRHFLRDLA